MCVVYLLFTSPLVSLLQMLLEHHDWLKVPEIHWEQTTDRVLTMEYCEGETAQDEIPT